MNTKPHVRLTWPALRYALVNATNRSFYAGLAILVLLAAGFAHYGQVLFAGVMVVLAVVGVGLLAHSSLVEYSVAEAHNKFAMLSNWAHGANSDAERTRRWALLQSGDLDEAWRSADLDYAGPRYNLDGTLMLPGHSNFDINGNVYGSTELASATFNAGTGEWTDPATAYTSPLADTGISDTGMSGTSPFGMD